MRSSSLPNHLLSFQALNGVETLNFEFPLYTITGAMVDVLLNATSRRDARGNIVGVVGVGQVPGASPAFCNNTRKSTIFGLLWFRVVWADCIRVALWPPCPSKG